VDVVFPVFDVVFKRGGVCEGVRNCPVVFGDVYCDEVVVLEKEAC
jgi:hypothetical protein